MKCDTLDRFSDACLNAGMKICTTKTENMCLSRHPVWCSFQTNEVTVQQTEKFKYLGVTFSSDGRQDTMDTRHPCWKSKCSNAPALPIGQRELCIKAKLSVFFSSSPIVMSVR